MPKAQRMSRGPMRGRQMQPRQAPEQDQGPTMPGVGPSLPVRSRFRGLDLPSVPTAPSEEIAGPSPFTYPGDPRLAASQQAVQAGISGMGQVPRYRRAFYGAQGGDLGFRGGGQGGALQYILSLLGGGRRGLGNEGMVY